MDRAWLLQGINVRFEKPVRTNAPINAYTAVKSLRGVLSERGSIIKQNDEVVAKSIANWCLLDTDRMRLARIPKEMTDSYEHYDFGDEFFTYVRPEVFEDAECRYTIRVSNKEIDTNRHLNNQKGAELLMDALPFDFEFNYMNVIYKKQAYLGTELFAYKEETDNGYYVHLMTKEKEICLAGTFENI